MFILLQLSTLKQVQVHVLSLKWGLKIAKEFLVAVENLDQDASDQPRNPFPSFLSLIELQVNLHNSSHNTQSHSIIHFYSFKIFLLFWLAKITQ